jgi:hypothetical protein
MLGFINNKPPGSKGGFSLVLVTGLIASVLGLGAFKSLEIGNNEALPRVLTGSDETEAVICSTNTYNGRLSFYKYKRLPNHPIFKIPSQFDIAVKLISYQIQEVLKKRIKKEPLNGVEVVLMEGNTCRNSPPEVILYKVSCTWKRVVIGSYYGINQYTFVWVKNEDSQGSCNKDD